MPRPAWSEKARWFRRFGSSSDLTAHHDRTRSAGPGTRGRQDDADHGPPDRCADPDHAAPRRRSPRPRRQPRLPRPPPAATAADPFGFTGWILQQVFQPLTPR